MSFPVTRMRRLRRTAALRRMVEETRVTRDDFIYPFFVVEGRGKTNPVSSMPGISQLSIDRLEPAAEKVFKLGIPAVILFGIPEKKDDYGSGAYAENGVVQRTLRRLKKNLPDLVLVADVCLCEYTSHGHCGVITGNEVDNDRTIELLARSAVSLAAAGADIVAPSDMMDGRVGAIRSALDEAGFPNTVIMSYAAKYSSAFYGPFREAAQSAPRFGDRRSYQMDPPNLREALREITLDIDEGADIVMVKPALAYLDVIRKVRDRFDVPLAAYQVSGEYSMVKAASQQGWLDEKRVIYEMVTGLKRAGADLIISYFAPKIAEWMEKGEWP